MRVSSLLVAARSRARRLPPTVSIYEYIWWTWGSAPKGSFAMMMQGSQMQEKQTQNGQPREQGSREVTRPKRREKKEQEKCERAASFILRDERGEPRVLLETI